MNLGSPRNRRSECQQTARLAPDSYMSVSEARVSPRCHSERERRISA